MNRRVYRDSACDASIVYDDTNVTASVSACEVNVMLGTRELDLIVRTLNHVANDPELYRDIRVPMVPLMHLAAAFNDIQKEHRGQ